MMMYCRKNDISQMGFTYSYLGHRVLKGDIEAVKFLYGNAWKESPPLIRTIRELQYRLTAVEIENDTRSMYTNEFLYYWGMVCMGEVSRLVLKDLGTAEICFKNVLKNVPKAKARLAFIKLLVTDAPHKNESNIKSLDILRMWAGKQDLFSRIVLAKIIYFEFLQENQEDNLELPIRALQLLGLPCQLGHPLAIKFCNEMLENTGISKALDMKVSESHIDSCALYDY